MARICNKGGSVWTFIFMSDKGNSAHLARALIRVDKSAPWLGASMSRARPNTVFCLKTSPISE